MLTDAALLNALAAQKEAVLELVKKAEDAADLHKALATLGLLEPVWEAVGYRYKAAEIRADIRSRAWDLKRGEEEQLPHYRRGSRLHNITLHDIKELESIITSL